MFASRYVCIYFGKKTRSHLYLQKGALLPEKKIESEFPVEMHIYMVQSFMKFCLAVSNKLHWQEKQDWLTDWRVKNIIPSATCCVGYNNC